MGYTNGWYRTPTAEPREAYGLLSLDASRIIAAAQVLGIKLADGSGEGGSPEITEGHISFNGLGEESCETFYWPADLVDSLRQDVAWFQEQAGPNDIGARHYQQKVDTALAGGMVLGFTKTGREPYDAVVKAILLRAKVHYGDSLELSCEGTWDHEWVHGAMVWSDEQVAEGQHELSGVDLVRALWPEESIEPVVKA